MPEHRLTICYALPKANLVATYDNGASGIGATLTDAMGTFLPFIADNYTAHVGNRILVSFQDNPIHNGIYDLIQNGDGISLPWILRRSSDFDEGIELNTGDYVFIALGDTYGSSNWEFVSIEPFIIGTSNIIFNITYKAYITSEAIPGQMCVFTHGEILNNSGINVDVDVNVTGIKDLTTTGKVLIGGETMFSGQTVFPDIGFSNYKIQFYIDGTDLKVKFKNGSGTIFDKIVNLT